MPGRDVVLASDAPPVAAVAQLEPQLVGDADRDAPRARRSPPSSPWAGASRALDHHASTSGTRRLRAHALDLGLGLLERRERRASAVHLQLASLGHDVRPRAAVDDADVHGDAGPAAVQRLERHDRVGGLAARRCAPSPARRRRAPRVRDRDAVVGDPLARRHDVAVRARALQDESRVVRRGAISRITGPRTASRSPRRGCRRT